jgi:hypothetical protein
MKYRQIRNMFMLVSDQDLDFQRHTKYVVVFYVFS